MPKIAETVNNILKTIWEHIKEAIFGVSVDKRIQHVIPSSKGVL